MKFKATKRAMNQNYHRVISIGYCAAQHLLRHTEPIAYSTRTEGWACDYYEVDDVLISSGYAPLSAKNTKSTYDILKKYNDAAREIACNYSIKYEDQEAQINELLHQFVKEVME